mmetsp:Transcript_2749/g.4746  ORF Transcript_2749/g.4746 Transcript_2749/m.4746 type:complete len:259 (-) Transcript_2749:669-1445(-)
MWLVLSRSPQRLTKPSFIMSAPDSSAPAVHLATLFLLFLVSKASNALRCVSIFFRQSCVRTSCSLRALTTMNWSSPLLLIMASSSHRTTMSMLVSSFNRHLRYLYAQLANSSPGNAKGLGSGNLCFSPRFCITCCEKFWLMAVASRASCCMPLMLSLSSATSSVAVSLTVSRCKLEAARRSKNTLPSAFVMTRSQLYLADLTHMSVVRIESVAKTCAAPSVDSFLMIGSSDVVTLRNARLVFSSTVSDLTETRSKALS